MGGVKQATCRKGHPLADPNLHYNSRGERQCLTCRRATAAKSQRKHRAEQREAAQRVAPCHHRWAQHVCIGDAGHTTTDHHCPCGDTWGIPGARHKEDR